MHILLAPDSFKESLSAKQVAEALKTLDRRPDMQEDLASGDWKFGRGSCDMKAALALQLLSLIHI